MKWLSMILFFSSLVTSHLVTQDAKVNGDSMLPGDDFMPGWKQTGPARTFVKEDLFNHIDGGAETYLEFGFSRVLVQRYQEGKNEVTLEVYEMSGPASALAVYLQRRGHETPLPGIAAQNSGDRYQVMARKGRMILQVNNPSGEAALLPGMTTLVNLAAAAAAEESEPTPLDLLPQEGRVPGSELLLRGPYSLQSITTLGEGDILGLGGKIWAAAGDYRGADGSAFTRITVPYPDEKSAAAAFDRLRENLDPYLKPIKREPGKITFQDYAGLFGRIELKEKSLEIGVRLKRL